jgi:hypothetical protein
VQFGDAAAEAVEQDRDVLVLLGVDADDDIVGPKLHAGHGWGSSWQFPVAGPLVGRADRTAMRPWSSQAPIRSLPARPAVGKVAATRADRSTRRHPQGRS